MRRNTKTLISKLPAIQFYERKRLEFIPEADCSFNLRKPTEWNFCYINVKQVPTHCSEASCEINLNLDVSKRVKGLM